MKFKFITIIVIGIVFVATTGNNANAEERNISTAHARIDVSSSNDSIFFKLKLDTVTIIKDWCLEWKLASKPDLKLLLLRQ